MVPFKLYMIPVSLRLCIYITILIKFEHSHSISKCYTDTEILVSSLQLLFSKSESLIISFEQLVLDLLYAFLKIHCHLVNVSILITLEGGFFF